MLPPNRYRILTIGRVRKDWIRNGISLYLKRLPGLEIRELRESNPQQETKVIKASLKRNEFLVILDEKGEHLTSISFAKRLKDINAQRIVFVIGGANGLTPELKAMADWQLSLSPMTFPHEIARLLLIEQLYRAQTIWQGSPYHRH